MKVLILDDDSNTDLRLMATAAIDLGHEVEATADPVAFLDASRRLRPDLQVVDHKLHGIEQSAGMRDGPELVAVGAAESLHVPTVFFTSWKGDCVRRLKELDPRLLAALAEKPVTHSPDVWRAKLQGAIQAIEATPGFERPQLLGMPVDEMVTPLFRLSSRDLHGLVEEDRDALEIEAGEELHPFLDSAWKACDDDWLMVCRTDGAVLVLDRGKNANLPTVEAVRDLEVERDSAVLTIGRPAYIEEGGATGSVHCSPEEPRDWRRYPYARLIVGSDEREFHLDTGSPRTYISREFVREHHPGVLRNPQPVKLQRRDWSETRIQEPVDLDLHVVGPSGNIALSLTVQAVKNWAAFDMLNPPCHNQGCPDSFASRGQCGRRLGLLGRDLLYEVNGAFWVFDPAAGRFYVREF